MDNIWIVLIIIAGSFLFAFISVWLPTRDSHSESGEEKNSEA